jgi:hypothetical protein
MKIFAVDEFIDYRFSKTEAYFFDRQDAVDMFTLLEDTAPQDRSYAIRTNECVVRMYISRKGFERGPIWFSRKKAEAWAQENTGYEIKEIYENDYVNINQTCDDIGVTYVLGEPTIGYLIICSED